MFQTIPAFEKYGDGFICNNLFDVRLIATVGRQ